MNVWSCYIIMNDTSSTYVGATTNPERRIRQHNAEIKGGAKYTTSKGSGWFFVCIISGFDKIGALQFEWALKNNKMNSRGIKSRIENLYCVLNKNKWTSNSCDAINVPLIVEWYKTEYMLQIQCPNYVRHVTVSKSAIFEDEKKNE